MKDKNNFKESRLASYYDMKKELETYERRGIVISLEGEKINAEKVAHMCCLEGHRDYMRDYVMDDDDRLIEIGFNKVSLY